MRNIPDTESDARRLLDLLSRLGRRQSLRDPLASIVESLEITPAQMHAVLWLGRDRELTMGELARLAGINDKTATGLIDRLEQKGLVMRERSEADRRVVHVRLTASGEASFQNIEAEIFKKTCGFLSLISDDDRQSLFRIMDNLLALECSPGDGAPVTDKP